MKNKNEPNSSLKCNFLLVTLGEKVANGSASKRSLFMQFEECGGCGGVDETKMAKSDHPQGNNPKLLKSLLWRLFFVTIPTTKHILINLAFQKDSVGP